MLINDAVKSYGGFVIWLDPVDAAGKQIYIKKPLDRAREQLMKVKLTRGTLVIPLNSLLSILIMGTVARKGQFSQSITQNCRSLINLKCCCPRVMLLSVCRKDLSRSYQLVR